MSVKYPNHPCHWWPNLTADDATEDEIEAVHQIAGDDSNLRGMTWQQYRENLRACAKALRKIERPTQDPTAQPPLTEQAGTEQSKIDSLIIGKCHSDILGLRKENAALKAELAALNQTRKVCDAEREYLRKQLLDVKAQLAQQPASGTVPAVGSKVTIYGNEVVEVVEETANGFRYKGATPLSIPRLGIYGDGRGEYFSKINPQAKWEYAPPAQPLPAGEMTDWMEDTRLLDWLKRHGTSVITPKLRTAIRAAMRSHDKGGKA